MLCPLSPGFVHSLALRGELTGDEQSRRAQPKRNARFRDRVLPTTMGEVYFVRLRLAPPQNVTVRSNPMALVMVKLPALSTCRTR